MMEESTLLRDYSFSIIKDDQEDTFVSTLKDKTF
jgi:hypothetical protein